MTKRKQYPKFKAYFYNGFDKPKLLATSITGLERDIRISDNYLGDLTSEVREYIRDFKQGKESFDDLKEYLADYDILIDPSLDELKDFACQWFPRNELPMHHFEDFENEVSDLEKYFDNFTYNPRKSYDEESIIDISLEYLQGCDEFSRADKVFLHEIGLNNYETKEIENLHTKGLI